MPDIVGEQLTTLVDQVYQKLKVQLLVIRCLCKEVQSVSNDNVYVVLVWGLVGEYKCDDFGKAGGLE